MKAKLLFLAFAFTAFAGTAHGQSPSFEIRRGQYLWHVWESPEYRQKYTWREFWEEVSKLNAIPETDSAWRSLPRGKVILLPANPTGSLLSDSLSALGSRIDSLKNANARLAAEVQERPKRDETFGWLLTALIASAMAAIILGVLLAYRRREYEKSMRDNDIMEDYVSRHCVLYELPEGMARKDAKSRYVYLPRHSPIDGDETVFIIGLGPVKVKNLTSAFFNALPEVLDRHGLTITRSTHDVSASRASGTPRRERSKMFSRP